MKLVQTKGTSLSRPCRAGSFSRKVQRQVVRNVFSLSGAVSHIMKTRREDNVQQLAGAPRKAAAVEAPPAVSSTIVPRKSVQAVPIKDRSTVELVMALTNLTTASGVSLATQLSEHELQLVTTSATCDEMFGSALDSFSEDFESSGDGMALPIADIRAAAEQLAAEVHGASIASDWNPAQSPGSGNFSGSRRPGQPGPHTLEQLMAQSDYDQLASSPAKDTSTIFARVQALQTQIKQAASGVGKVTGATGTANNISRQASNKDHPTASLRKQKPVMPPPAASDDDDYGDAAAMPVVPQLGAATAKLPAFASNLALKVKAAQPSYPTYTDPASSWIVAGSADGKLRYIVIQAPVSLAAAVAGTRASSDLTTFENYSMGAKINKRLYQEANALYNRFMPLVLDHLEEGGPDARIMLSGVGLGGSLAGLLLMMFVARGMRSTAFAPVHTLNAPAVLCEVPDFKQWCSKDGCSLQDMDGMLEDLLHRGILSQLGLPQDAIRNIYHQQAAAEAAVQAVTPFGPLQAMAATSSKQLSSMVQYFDVDALQQSPYVPDVLKSWLKHEASGVHASYQRLHILNPVGKMMLYVGATKA